MSDRSDRVLILLIAATGLLGLLGWVFGLLSRSEETIAGVSDTMALGLLTLLFLVLVVAALLRSNRRVTD